MVTSTYNKFKQFFFTNDGQVFADINFLFRSSVVLDRDGTATGHTPVSDDQHAAFVNRLHGYGITQSCMTHTSWEVAVYVILETFQVRNLRY